MQSADASPSGGRTIGRYLIFGEIAAGGMATVHLGRLLGAVGFTRTVAIKRLHPQYAKDVAFVSMFLDEARLASRIRHPNVVGSLDVVSEAGELLLVMEYVHGETLARLLRLADRCGLRPSPSVVCSIVTDTLYGLHAAHTATGENGIPLGIIHRDVTPQNIMVGADGVARVLDFGVAKASMRSQTTNQGEVKGKVAYMAPEQLRGEEIDQRADIFSAGVVLWEALGMHRLFQDDNVGAVVSNVLMGSIPPPSHYNTELPVELDSVVLRALARNRDQRYQTARELATALESALDPASPGEVGEWVSTVAAESLAERAELLGEIETSSAHLVLRKALEPPDLTAAAPASRTDEPVSHVANVAVPAGTPQVKPARSRRWWVVGIVAVLALALLGAVALRKVSAPGAPALAGKPDSSALVAPARATPPPAAGLAPTTPAPVAERREQPAAQASTSEAAPRPSAAPARAPKPVAAKRGSCNPPYRVDANGIRRIRPECL